MILGRAETQQTVQAELVSQGTTATQNNTRSREVTGALKKWMLKQRCIPGGLLRQKLKHVSTRWTELTRFLDDPRIPLDNNRTEGAYIGMAIGRRNYIGARSQRGTEVAACFFWGATRRGCTIDLVGQVEFSQKDLLAEPFGKDDGITASVGVAFRF